MNYFKNPDKKQYTYYSKVIGGRVNITIDKSSKFNLKLIENYFASYGYNKYEAKNILKSIAKKTRCYNEFDCENLYEEFSLEERSLLLNLLIDHKSPIQVESLSMLALKLCD